jgi:pimeloyl-ACP methyl ester carboxylesterase
LGVPRDAPQFQGPGVLSPEDFDRFAIEAQERLNKLSTNSELLVAEKSGHMINFDQPELVIEAIRRVVLAVREGKALA